MKNLITTILLFCCILTVKAQTETGKRFLALAQEGDGSAQYHIGLFYLDGDEGFPKDTEEAVIWFHKAAENGTNYSAQYACYYLGLCLKNKNREQAIYWLKKGMDMYYAENQIENEYHAEVLRDLGVIYHPSDKSTSSTNLTSGYSYSSNSISPTDAKSSNNDCFWYNRCLYFECDAQGNIIESSKKYLYPTKNYLFEIRFGYVNNYLSADYPMAVFLCERDGDIRNKQETICTVSRLHKKTLSLKEKKLAFFTVHPNTQVTVSSDGTIVLYKLDENGNYISGRYFYSKAAESLYSTRYDVLRSKLTSINWAK